MRYAIFNFLTGERGGCLPLNIIREVLKPDTECRISQATTREDEMYLGTAWECEHTLDPRECVHCNPAYRHAVWARCETCYPVPSTAENWHADGVCLKCNPTYGRVTPTGPHTEDRTEINKALGIGMDPGYPDHPDD
jgi:hypothetical protein